MSKRIVFTGGGSAGHVTPNVALIETMLPQGWDCYYIGSTTGMEAAILQPLGINYAGVSTGKLRRYFSFQNIIDPFKIAWGVAQALMHLKKIKPTIVFSKGGFVAFPVVVAAWLLRIPVIAHESDLTPGLANRLSFPFAKKICLTFEKGRRYFKRSDKLVVTGTPLRKRLLSGDALRAKTLCGFVDDLPCLLIIGGGQGAVAINTAVRAALDTLRQNFLIIHLCGKGKLEPRLMGVKNYQQFEYLGGELADCYALSDLVISRSGANSVYEILSLHKPHIFIPLPLCSSRGDQIHNARHFESIGVSQVIDEGNLTPKRLLTGIEQLMASQDKIKQKISQLGIHSGTDAIVRLIEEVVSC